MLAKAGCQDILPQAQREHKFLSRRMIRRWKSLGALGSWKQLYLA